MVEPVARSEGLVVEPMGDELLVFDAATGRAHSLNAAAVVWRACDGTRDVDALAACCALDPVAVGLALDLLRSCERVLGFEGPRVSRRQALRNAAVFGAGIAAVPVIRSITDPSVAMAASTACVSFDGSCAGQSCCSHNGKAIFCSAGGSLCKGYFSHYTELCSQDSACKRLHYCSDGLSI
jgi:hypothetical protein